MKKKALNKKILNVAEGWTVPFGAGSESRAKEAVFAKIGDIKIPGEPLVLAPEERKAPKIISINRFSGVKAAAVVALLVSIPYIVWLLGNETFENNGSTPTAYELPDGSKVVLASRASLDFNRWIWPVNRRLSLEGQAYFDVETGSNFRVNTSAGKVTVLGTAFSVWADGEAMMVHCDEGVVVVELDEQRIELHQGEFTRRKSQDVLSAKQMIAISGPLFAETSGIQTYDNAPVHLVLAQIESASGMVVYSDLSDTLMYSGSVNLSLPKQSLELVCKPYGAKFEINDEGYVTIRP
jgi:ferric-dicitrate binding protein FerR (iron transport regulator)